AAQLREALSGPDLGLPARAGPDQDVGMAGGESAGGAECAGPLPGGRGDGEIERDRQILKPERSREQIISIDRVQVGPAVGDAMGIKNRRELAGPGKAQPSLRPRRQGEKSAAKQTLQIEHQVETPPSQV